MIKYFLLKAIILLVVYPG